MSGIIGGAGSKSGIVGEPTTRFDEWVSNTVQTGTVTIGADGAGDMTNLRRKNLAVTESTGIFTLPELGWYFIECHVQMMLNGSSRYPYVLLQVSSGGGSYLTVAVDRNQMLDFSANSYQGFRCSEYYEATAATTVKFLMAGSSAGTTGVDANAFETGIRFTKV